MGTYGYFHLDRVNVDFATWVGEICVVDEDIAFANIFAWRDLPQNSFLPTSK